MRLNRSTGVEGPFFPSAEKYSGVEPRVGSLGIGTSRIGVAYLRGLSIVMQEQVFRAVQEAQGGDTQTSAKVVRGLIRVSAELQRSPDWREWLIQELNQVGPKIVSILTTIVNNNPQKDYLDLYCRREAVYLLARTTSQERSKILALITAATDKDEFVRQYAAWGLSRIEPAVKDLVCQMTKASDK